MRRILFPAAAAVCLMGAQPAAAATNLIKNGGFDDVAFSGEYVVYDATNTPADFGWSVLGNIDVHRNDGYFGGDPDPVGAGRYAVDLLGTSSQGSIYQALTLETGKTYRLSFDYSNNPFIAGAAMTFGIAIDGTLAVVESVGHSGATTNAMDWQTYTLEFTAIGSSAAIYFNNTAGNPGSGMYLDSVALYDISEPAAVPEPATWALMISGFGLAGTALRQRRRLTGAAA
ncbi:PEPxxWA-CTERM sorting domain-containing protein [Phenylobacterium sp.]|uniref:PEPxxWA-CTERM sorting domain-containing protein n=1 Tax=Phenylobacterium sp. TaxID=1871053 RepID=UPI0025D1B591|nr:PEPxxWA-CTERM sorting domain-containing protein [Phenylobacterium sp.]